jgi:hypothetical protein
MCSSAGSSSPGVRSVGAKKAAFLAFLGHRLAVEGVAAAEMQAHVSVRIAEFLHEPREGIGDLHAELLFELARKRLGGRLALFDLAARELPVARIGLAFGAGTQEHLAVLANQNGDGDFSNVVFTHG